MAEFNDIKHYIISGNDKKALIEITLNLISITEELIDKYIKNIDEKNLISSQILELINEVIKNNRSSDKHIIKIYDILSKLITKDDVENGRKVARLLELFTGILNPNDDNYTNIFLLNALYIRKLTLGENDIDTIHTYYNLGKVSKNLKKYNDALQYFEICLKNEEYLIQKNTRSDIYEKMSSVYKKIGNKEKELEFAQKHFNYILHGI